MTAPAVAPTEPVVPASTELTLQAPDGAHWEFEEVKTEKGTKSLGKENPILVWDDLDKARAHYTDEGLRSIMDGTSLRVSFQNIIRRGRASNKSFDDIAKLQIDFRPGKRVVGESTPASRVARQAKAAAEAGTVSEDNMSKLLELIKSGKLGDAEIAALTQ